MRVYALIALVGFLAVYAWKDWFKSLCGLIVLMAVIEHEDMPKTIMGIQGLNPWNLLMVVIVLAWLTHRRQEKLLWDMPHNLTALLLIGLLIILVGWFRMFLDRTHMEAFSPSSMISEELINTIKWVIPGLLIFDGCRDRTRLKWVLVSLLLLFLLLGVQIIRRTPPSAAFGGAGPNIQGLRLKASRSVGYSSVEMSVLLAGASWAFAAALIWAKKRRLKALLVLASFLMLYATALTGGRAGYVAWAITGFLFCVIRWRKLLLAAPLVPVVVAIAFPAAVDRLLFGVGETDISGRETINTYELSSGRLIVWPRVVEKIGEAPALGYGRRAMVRIGLTEGLQQDLGEAEAFPHPHNMYLEWLLDNGIIGMIPVVILFTILLTRIVQLFRERRDSLFAAAGGVCLALVASQLIGGLTSQHFYPQESTVAMWVALMLAVRLHMERKRAAADETRGIRADVRPAAAHSARLPVPSLATTARHE